ncbi:kinesin-like protein KIF26A isoform X2 [Erinaceus europaeus]|uniref:Kinesin-like protein KIF26A isoform X2 n=1 Tax=Erinaceus europaeus TaxID=9365 RepID=A0ABM3WKG7_ERIEU|nr:kinesin-like protein KIF26A isoform X2 [Erinaceus europaeus]
MALPPEPRRASSLLEVGALCLDPEAVLGFTSHLLRRRAKVAEGGPGRQVLEVAPRKRLPARSEQDPRGRRPAPEGAGAGAELGHSPGGAGWCGHCHAKLTELKRQAWKLVSDPGTPLRDPCLSALLLDTLPVRRPEAPNRCDACATPPHPLSAPLVRQDPRDGALPAPPASAGPDSEKGPAWPPGPSVQVSVAPAGLGGALSTVTFQAQQCLEGMWRVSGVHSLLPPTCLVPGEGVCLSWFQEEVSVCPFRSQEEVSVLPSGPRKMRLLLPCPGSAAGRCRRRGPRDGGAQAEAAVAAVAVADTVRDSAPSSGPDGVWKMWGRAGTCTATLLTPVPGAPSPTSGPSAATSFFIRAVQKLSLASKRKKPPPPPATSARGPSAYPTDFRGVLQLWPPPAPPCLLRAASKVKESPGNFGKVKVMLRIWPAPGAETSSFLKVDARRKQVTLYEPPGSAALRQPPAAVPRMFAFDAVFPQDSEQAEICSGAIADVLQSVVSGADGCVFSFGPSSLGTAYTMLGQDRCAQSLGVVPCAISWLFRLLEERRQSSGTRFSVRVSAVEASGRDAGPRDLLAEVASGGAQDTLFPGVVLQEDPGCGGQSPRELRAASAGQAALFLDAALAARSEDTGCSAPMLLTVHVDQHRGERAGKGAASGGHSRLHLIDLGSCSEVPGGPPGLSLSALGSVVLALVSGARHVPYRDHWLTMMLREPLATTHCRATMIAHVSAAPARLTETLSTLQLAARLHRLRRKRPKHASSSSGGDSSCEEGRACRPPLLRPPHSRPPALDPECPAPTMPGDRECSSSSEQSCDTVIYVGPGGLALSDRELTDGEGPPDSVPIIPALSRRRPPVGPRQADPLRCRTFAELQERLDGMAEGPPRCADPRGDAGPLPEPPDLDKDMGRSRRPPPSPVPSPPQLPEAPEEPRGGAPLCLARTPPVGGSGHGPWLASPGRRLELLPSVTLRRPVELNGEDELVLTGEEPLPSGRPSSLGSMGSTCSLQALASGSRPVSIISSINDELEAYTLQPPREPGAEGAPLGQLSLRPPLPPQPPQLSISPDPGCPLGLDGSSGLCDWESGDTRPSKGPPRQTLHSSLPRRAPPTTDQVATPLEDPWQLRAEDCALRDPPTVCAQRVVDGCEGVLRVAQRVDPGAPVPPLRRGATTLGVTTCPLEPSYRGVSSGRKGTTPRGGSTPRPAGATPPAPPVRKSSLEHRPGLAPGGDEEEARAGGYGDTLGSRSASILKARTGRVESVNRPGPQGALERTEGKAVGRAARPGPRLGTPPTSPIPPTAPVSRGPSKGMAACRLPAGGAKGTRAAARPGRGTIMGTKLRAAHCRVHELAAAGTPGSRQEVGQREGPALPSPYSTVTAPRRPPRHSSGHGSDNSSVLSGELPPAMGRTALFYHSGGSSGYGSMRLDSEATGSASSAPDSMSDSAASPGARARSLRSPKRRAAGLQRRRLAPAPLPDAPALGRKPSLPGQWVDLPPPLASVRKEPFEIKVYEIDDVERLQRRRAPPREDPVEAPQELDKGQRQAERRRQRLREVLTWRERLRRELAETQGRLMVEPGRWLEQFEVGPELEPESAEYLAALERATAGLERHLNLCKARVMMVTCFDIRPGPQQVDVDV